MSQPRMIGQYSLGERLAVGGAGEVFAAIDTKSRAGGEFLRPELVSDPDWVARHASSARHASRRKVRAQ
jgi:hypothetical protein